jgi:hypothetical protein
LSLKEELLFGRANIHLAFSLFSLSLLLLLLSPLMHYVRPLSLFDTMESHEKRVKKTKITIHHRTMKKNNGFLTNNKDIYVTNMNSFFFFLFLFVLYYIRILKRTGIRLYCLFKCIDKYIQKMHEIGNACGIIQDRILLCYRRSRSLSLSPSSFYHAPFDYVNVYKSVTTSTST